MLRVYVERRPVRRRWPCATGTGIVFEFVQACRRGSGVREVVFGLRSTEDPLLVALEEYLGFSVVQAPANPRINRLVAAVITPASRAR